MTSLQRLDFTICPNFCPQPWPVATVSATSAQQITTAKVSEWLSHYNNRFPRFEKMADNGLTSLLEREIQAFTEMHNEGLQFTSSPILNPGLSQLVRTLVTPRVEQLGRALVKAQTRCADKEAIKKDAKVQEKWTTLGMQAAVLEKHADCAHFLIESGLIFSIAGYRDTCGNSNLHDLKLDHDGHPMIKVQGVFKRWEIVKQELVFDKQSKQIRSRAYPGSIVQNWTYLHAQGLVPKNRYDYDQVFPVYQLSQEEYDRTRAHAARFYETNPEKDPGIAKDCIVQFFTIPNPDLRNDFVHVGTRVINADRQVYSFGIQMLPEEASYVLSDYFSTLLATADAKVCMLDYQEFFPDAKLVTSIPISTQRSQNILNFINSLTDKQLRFQYQRQNCSVIMQEVIQRAGYNVDTRTTGAAVIYEALGEGIVKIPVIGPLIAKVNACAARIWNALPWILTTPLEWTKTAVLFIPKKLGMVLVNLLALKMGAAKKTSPLRDDLEDETFYDKKGIQNFSSVIRSPLDLFREETSVVYHSKYFIDWQKQQRSSFETTDTGRPKLSIVPPVA